MVRGKAETKRFIESYLYKRSWTENLIRARHLKRALFVCDRDELRSQALAAFQNVFGADAAEVYEEPDGKNHARNACIHIATYQTLDVWTPKTAPPISSPDIIRLIISAILWCWQASGDIRRLKSNWRLSTNCWRRF